MQPIATTKGKLTQLRYELSERVHEAKIYPVKAPNGSTILLYAHDTGVSVIWRGGRPLKKAALPSKQAPKPQKVNGSNNDAIMIIDSDDDEPAKPPVAPSIPQAEFEDEEEELDSDQPYPSIVQQIRLSFNTEVLHIAVPQVHTTSALRPADTTPPIFSKKLVFTATCADCTIRIVTLPLSPPPQSAKGKPLSAGSHYGEEIVKFHGHQSIARGVAMTWTSREEQSGRQETDDEMDVDVDVDVTGNAGATPGQRRKTQQSRSRSRPAAAAGFDILVATHSGEVGGLFKIWRFELTETSVNGAHPIVPYKTVTLRKPASSIAFNTAQYPKRRHSQLLITDLTGTARVYDAFAPASCKRSSSGQTETGAFIATFKSAFEGMRSTSLIPPILATRKAILDAAWASDGRHILALLSDGEWGVWDCDQSGPSPSTDPASFSLRGFVGTSEKEASSSGPSSPKRGGRSSLAPMTPNTRRRKEDNLFHGSSSGIAVPMRGGVSVASTTSSKGAVSEDSVVMWYGSEVYRIADLAKFWARNTSASRGQSLPGPGVAQIYDIPLLGESITSVLQFDTTAAASRMAIGRDILIAAEHRLIVSASTNQPQERDLFAPTAAEEEASRRADQALLTRGELDIGGMDRLLEDMESSGSGVKSLTMGNPRKVLFASSAA